MDHFTSFETLEDKEGKIVGFKINSGPATEDEHFCEMFPKNLREGEASITVFYRRISIESIGLYGKEEWNFDLSGNEEIQLEEILSGLGRSYQGHCEVERGFGCSLIVFFKEIAPLNKRERGKRKRSFWRNPTSPKNKSKISDWKKIYT
jgi:hypothetical protein